MRLLYDSHAYAYHHHADDHVGGEDLLRRFREIYALVCDNGVLYQKTDVIDTFVFRTLRTTGNPSQAMALSLFQSVIIRNSYSFLPDEIFLEAYKMLFKNGTEVIWCYGNSFLVTVSGTVCPVLIIPSLIFSPFNLFLMRNYMREIPPSLMESVKLDGVNDGQGVFGRPAQKL